MTWPTDHVSRGSLGSTKTLPFWLAERRHVTFYTSLFVGRALKLANHAVKNRLNLMNKVYFIPNLHEKVIKMAKFYFAFHTHPTLLIYRLLTWARLWLYNCLKFFELVTGTLTIPIIKLEIMHVLIFSFRLQHIWWIDPNIRRKF